MRIGTLAAVAVLMIVVGLPLYSIGDMTAGAYLAVAGLLLALAAFVAAHAWAWSQDETDFR
jgi:hypothetical protein